MAIDVNKHAAVVMVNNDVALGFPHIYSAVAFVERQLSLVTDKSKTFAMVMDSIVEDDGLTVGGINFQIMDTDSYFDNYADVQDEDDELPVAE